MKKYTKEFFQKMGSIGGKTTANKYGSEHYKKIAEQTNKKKKEKREQNEK